MQETRRPYLELQNLYLKKVNGATVNSTKVVVVTVTFQRSNQQLKFLKNGVNSCFAADSSKALLLFEIPGRASSASAASS